MLVSDTWSGRWQVAVDEAVKEYVLAAALDTSNAAEQALQEAVGPLLEAAGAGDEAEVQDLLSVLWQAVRGPDPPSLSRAGAAGGGPAAAAKRGGGDRGGGRGRGRGRVERDGVVALVGMGFSRGDAERALDRAQGNVDAALEVLLQG